jgi:hypothetical protein
MRPQLLLLAGLLLGALMGFAFLEAGTLTVIPDLFVWIWLLVKRPRFLGAAGGLIGFGGSWLVLLGWASWSCAHDFSCWQPDVSAWLVVAALLVGSGALIGLGAWPQMATA